MWTAAIATVSLILIVSFCIRSLSLRKARAGGTRPSVRGTASAMVRTGMLEMQALLEPEKKLEVLARGEVDEKRDLSPGDPLER